MIKRRIKIKAKDLKMNDGDIFEVDGCKKSSRKILKLNVTPPSYPTAFGLNSNKWPLLHDDNHNFKPNFVRLDSDEVIEPK